MALTRAQIIGEALSQIGRADLTSNGRLWLNLFLEKVYKAYDWPWLVKDGGIISLSQGASTPSDYWKMKEMNLVLNGVEINPITTCTIDEYVGLLRQNMAASAPRRLYIDENLKTFNFWPTPDIAYNWHPFYYYMPVLPTHTDSSGDASTPKWSLHDDFLIRAVQLKALYYQDDQRYSQEEQDLMKELMDSRMNAIDFRAGKNKIKLGRSFRRRF